ncbi:hypothetical protein DH2020_034410 [Rehmannia glutinosa]|uniref:Uncharacterized protein n=1 Tax=Rehmannia glutinosa TaxID=99300 RepID=A0ABR0VBY7_REHGL
MGFGAHNCVKESHCAPEDELVFNSRDCFQDICFLLDDMTNKGLCSFVKILTGGMIKFEKTNWSMKRAIKELLPKVIADKNDISKMKLKQLFQLLKDPKNFCGNQVACSTAFEAYRAAAIKVLDGLEDFPVRALSAMLRKLRGVRGYIPSLNPPRSGRARDNLINLVRKMCMKMLLDHGQVDEPAEGLAGALGVAGLTLKLIMNTPAVRDFRRFSPEIEALHNDIAKAIHLLNNSKKLSLIELKKVQVLLDPDFKLSDRSLRSAVRNLLTDYLYECSDMDKVPDCLVGILDIINRRSQLPSRKKNSSSESHSSPQELMKEVMQKEVEYVLTISAQAKEVVLDLLPEHEFDEDFAHAYVEDFEGSDALCISDDDEQVGEHCEFHFCNSYGQTESIGETMPVELNSPSPASKRDACSPLCSPNSRLDVPLESMHISKMDSDESGGFVHSVSCKKSNVLDGQCSTRKHSSGFSGELGLAYSNSPKVTTKLNLPSLSLSHAKNSSHHVIKNEETRSCSATTPKCVFSDVPLEETNIDSQQSRSGNQYLEVQEACDVTSMVAYRFVGHMLDKLAKIEGLVLYQGDRLYLRSHSSVLEDSKVYKILPLSRAVLSIHDIAQHTESTVKFLARCTMKIDLSEGAPNSEINELSILPLWSCI